MRFAEMTYPEVASFAADGAVAVVPMGCTEQQGPHLTVGFDTWFAEELTAAASQRASEVFGIESVVLPAVPFGPTPEHRGFGAGYVDLPRAVHDALVGAILGSLAEQRFARIVVWRGCGGHDLVEAVQTFNKQRASSCRAWLCPATESALEHPFREIWCRMGDQRDIGGHADSFTTSIALYRHPEWVRPALIPGPSREPNWDDPQIDFTRYSDTGVIGDPRYGNADLGRRLWDECVVTVATVLHEVADSPVDASSR